MVGVMCRTTPPRQTMEIETVAAAETQKRPKKRSRPPPMHTGEATVVGALLLSFPGIGPCEPPLVARHSIHRDDTAARLEAAASPSDRLILRTTHRVQQRRFLAA